MTDFYMNDILRSFRKMRMNKSQSAQISSTHQQQQQHQQRYNNPYRYNYNYQIVQRSPMQQCKDLKKIIKIIKKTVIKQKITRKMNIIV
ncbi:uncharacterized protein LOC117134843 [Drosophila busckii]|uniref:uncharacterized protein LOC117134843 n=1 Tax=Drosophila busckii TaxID=30019 RepID=UPI001432B804|nr:uncharacterized protein LOC117134843 [Drosophila busckii]